MYGLVDRKDSQRVRVRRASDTELRSQKEDTPDVESSTIGTPIGALGISTTYSSEDKNNAVDSIIDGSITALLARTKSKRRRNSEVDSVHKALPDIHISPAQLYSTESGHLYHAGKVCIILVGLPARGKTHHAVALTRYLRWLGVKAHAFHMGDYRRKLQKPGQEMPKDYFRVNATEETVAFRKKVFHSCMSDVDAFFTCQNGQVAIYDAVNALASWRRDLAQHFMSGGIYPFFVECLATDEKLVIRNIRDVKITSPDYKDMDADEAVAHYLRRIEVGIPDYEPMNETELSYVKTINACEKIIMNAGKLRFGYLQNRIIYFLMNAKIKVGSVYFARAGMSDVAEEDYKADEPLSSRGKEYAQKLMETLWKHIDKRRERSSKDLTLELLTRNLKINTGPEGYPLLKSGRCRSGTTSSSVSREGSRRQSITGDILSPPESSGASTPQNAQDALNISTIRADTLNKFARSTLTIWCSPRLRTVETAAVFSEEGNFVTPRSQLTQLNPGDAGVLSKQELKEKYPEEYKNHQIDPYHHRYPRGESYQDVAVRLEPLIMEMERTTNDLLIIAHESVLRVLYGYLMACSVNDIPLLKFPVNEIVEIIPNAYMNQANRIPIPGVEP